MEQLDFAKQTITTLSSRRRQFNRLVNSEYKTFEKMSYEKPKPMKQEYSEEEIKSVLLDLDEIDVDKLQI